MSGKNKEKDMSSLARPTVNRALEFANLLCVAMRKWTYACVVDTDGYYATGEVHVVGDAPYVIPTTRSPYIVLRKMGEMLELGPSATNRLLMTPVFNSSHTSGYMGGVGYKGLYFATSRWPEQWDKLLSLVVLYHMKMEPLVLHHVGFRYPNLETMMEASKGFELGFARPVSDHYRIYIPEVALTVETDTLVSGHDHYFVELQFFPKGPHTVASHWDIVTEHPYAFLKRIAHAFGQEPVFWNPGRNDSVGVVWIKNDEGEELGVMARRAWFDPSKTSF